MTKFNQIFKCFSRFVFIIQVCDTRTLCTPSFIARVISKNHYLKIWHVSPGIAKNMHPLIWGRKRKRSVFSRSYCLFSFPFQNHQKRGTFWLASWGEDLLGVGSGVLFFFTFSDENWLCCTSFYRFFDNLRKIFLTSG